MSENRRVLQNNREKQISADKKLELVQHIRMQNNYERNLCREREQLIFGKAPNEGDGVQNTEFSGFRQRFLLAAVLFFLFVFTDVRQENVAENATEKIVNMMQEDVTFNFIDL